MKTSLKLKLVVLFLTAFSCSNDDTPDPKETKSDAKQLLSFSFLNNENANLTTDIVATIDESDKTISVSVPIGTDVLALNPKITVSENASFTPSGPQNFSVPINYTITAEDGSQVVYTATISIMEVNSVLDNVNPLEGPKGTLVTIGGSGFGLDPSNVSVFFNEVEAVVQSVSDTEIIAEVPPRAYTGTVKVITGNMELTGPIFSYTLSEVIVSTLAGNGTLGLEDGPGTMARFKEPTGVAVDLQGTIYVADALNNRIRKITPEGIVSTLAGNTAGFADGIGNESKFKIPTDLAVNEEGIVYVVDNENQRIRKITPEGVVSTLAGSTQGFENGPGVSARFISPWGITLDAQGVLFVTEIANPRIRKITPEGMVSTFAGSTRGFEDGMGTAAKFDAPLGIAVNGQGTFFVVDNNNEKIRKITPEGMVSTFAGSTQGFADGQADIAQFNNPLGIAIDSQGIIYVADTRNHKIRKITPDGVVSTLAGSSPGFADGTGATAQFQVPAGIAVDSNGTVYVADEGNHSIRKIVQE